MGYVGKGVVWAMQWCQNAQYCGSCDDVGWYKRTSGRQQWSAATRATTRELHTLLILYSRLVLAGYGEAVEGTEPVTQRMAANVAERRSSLPSGSGSVAITLLENGQIV